MLLRYLGKRIIYMVFVFLLISIIIFGLFQLVPGDPVLRFMDPVELQLPPGMREVIENQIRQRMGFDQPVHIQYIRWLTGMLQGDFGQSIVAMQPVSQVLPEPLLITLQINIVVMLIVFAIAIPLGISLAVKKGGVYDNGIQTVTLLGMSLPIFLIAIGAIMLFSVALDLTPVSGFGNPLFPIENPDATAWEIFLDRLPFMILPISVLSFASLAGLTRFIRVAMIDALSQDYIRTARSKGLGEGSVIWRHAFRNSLIPFVTSLVAWLISLLSGSIMIETIFGIRGMGLLFFNSIMAFDWNMALVINTIFVVIALIGYLLVDFAYVLVDPRVRLT
jgi:peptide/nickel transport system permease protein